jgi:hypothetical protein
MIAGPEQVRLLKEFEQEYSFEEDDKHQHHEEGMSTQRTFKEQALTLVHTISEMGNPFLDDTQGSIQHLSQVGDIRPYTQHSRSNQKELTASLQMPNTQAQEQAVAANRNVEG